MGWVQGPIDESCGVAVVGLGDPIDQSCGVAVVGLGGPIDQSCGVAVVGLGGPIDHRAVGWRWLGWGPYRSEVWGGGGWVGFRAL